MHNIRNKIEYTSIILEIRLSTHTFSPRYATDVNSMGAGRMICRVGAQKIFSFQGRGLHACIFLKAHAISPLHERHYLHKSIHSLVRKRQKSDFV